jgi:uncharacterized protein YecE (DUF72 family)
MIETEKALKNFFKAAKELKTKLGPVLFQLPPGWNYNKERFIAFVEKLQSKYLYVFEFRNKSWWNDEVLMVLEKNKIAFCIFELDKIKTPKEITADFVYIRLHGPDGKYKGDYSKKMLSSWADSFAKWRKKGKDIFAILIMMKKVMLQKMPWN